jgi:hypothetical protein
MFEEEQTDVVRFGRCQHPSIISPNAGVEAHSKFAEADPILLPTENFGDRTLGAHRPNSNGTSCVG